jgi:ABC-2 type transport system ATP-binding protein
MTDAITIRNVNKSFGSKVAVRDLDLVVPAGSLTGFIGPNGAGKTTTIRMVMSIIFQDSGTISVLGKPSAIESKDRIGYLPEERGLYKKMKVGAFLSYMASIKGLDGSAIAPVVRAWLDRVGLPDVAKKKCEELSKGMQQKVQFISAVINNPELLILDEVFTGLDPLNRRLMRELIDEQHKRGATIVFSTHAMYEAEQLCDRIFMIHKGQKKLDGTLSDILARHDPRTLVLEPLQAAALRSPEQWTQVPGVARAWATAREIELKLDDGGEPQRVIASLAASGLGGGVRRIEIKRPNLEDIFIQLAGGDRAVLESDASDEDVALPASRASNAASLANAR